jgi:hypothetical protein
MFSNKGSTAMWVLKKPFQVMIFHHFGLILQRFPLSRVADDYPSSQ